MLEEIKQDLGEKIEKAEKELNKLLDERQGWHREREEMKEGMKKLQGIVATRSTSSIAPIAPSGTYPKSDIDEPRSTGELYDDALAMVTSDSDRTCVRSLMNSDGIEDGAARLRVAAKAGHKAEVWLLLHEFGIHPDSADSTKRTPVMEAAKGGNESVIQVLLDKGANPDSMDIWGQTPLWWAAWHGHIDIARKLFLAGADPVDESLRTTVMQAANRGRNSVPIIAQLEQILSCTGCGNIHKLG
jgi:hypothetical protein